MTHPIVVRPEHFEYLRLQKGRIADLAGDFPRWLAEYRRLIQADFDDLRPWIPANCRNVMDIGSGLGGVDILIGEHISPNAGQLTLVDGIDDPPVVSNHRTTFSSLPVALSFLRQNGAPWRHVIGVAPADLARRAEDPRDWHRKVHMALSLGSWCFHYPPSVYLHAVRAMVGVDAPIIVDMRADKPAWFSEMAGAFTYVATIRESEKYSRMVFRA